MIDIQYFDSLPFRGESHTQVKLLQTMCGDGRMRISGKSTMCINVEECMKHCEAPFRWLWSPYKNNQLSWALFIEHSHVLEQPLYIQSGEWSSIEINMVTINYNEPNSKDFPFLCLHERFFLKPYHCMFWPWHTMVIVILNKSTKVRWTDPPCNQSPILYSRVRISNPSTGKPD